MNTSEFVTAVRSHLPVELPDPSDEPGIVAWIEQAHRKGWTIPDAVRFCSLLEEIDPIGRDDEVGDKIEKRRCDQLAALEAKYLR